MPNNYAQFWKCALQVNPSTYSEKYRGHNHRLESDQYIDELLKVCLEENIKIVGIADHGDVSEVDAIRSKLSDSGIIVFPGFEIASSEKIHWVCLFPEETSVKDLNRYLGELGIRGDEGTIPSTHSAKVILQKMSELGGFCYGAHCTDDNGILYKGKMNHIWTDPLLHAVQIPGAIEDLGDKKQIIENKDPSYYREKPLGIINAKDVDEPSTLKDPKASCFIKMTNPNFDAFKVAFKDPESRIRLHGQIKNVQYSRIKEVSFVGGYLDGIRLDFSPHLNCVIGGRGTGKSTIIECIRYALDLEPKGKEARTLHSEIVGENLGKEKARIEITLISAEHHGNVYKVVRTYGEVPMVIDQAENVSAMRPKDLLPNIEIYGQNEIYELAKDDLAILKVLNRFLPQDAKEYEERLSEIQTELVEVHGKLTEIDKRKDRLQTKVSQIPKLEERVADFKKRGIDEKLKKIPLLEREKVLSRKTREGLSSLGEYLDGFKENTLSISFFQKSDCIDLVHTTELHLILDKLEKMKHDVNTMLSSFSEKLLESIDEILAVDTGLNELIKSDESEVEKQFSSLDSVAGKTGREIGEEYRRVLSSLEQTRPLKEELFSLTEEEEGVSQQRRNILARLSDVRFNRTEALKKSAKNISRKLRDKLLVEVLPDANRENLKSFLCEVPGLGQRKLQWIDDTDDIAVSTLVDAINQGEEKVKELGWGITESVANILCTMPLEKRMALEGIYLEDKISIKLNVGSEENPIYRPLNKLSTGQQCTALLFLLLLENKEPLIVDQPEDNLDNAFIADMIVQELRSTKTERQFVFATHNANIPVFGDAEWIGVITSDSERAGIEPEDQGSIDVPSIKDNVANILEGGRAAFIQRKEKYDF